MRHWFEPNGEPVGFVRIDIAQVQAAGGKRFLIAGIDRTGKFAVIQRVGKAHWKTAWAFLQHMLGAVPHRMPTILTPSWTFPSEIPCRVMYSGIQFAGQPRNRNTILSRPRCFDMICYGETLFASGLVAV